ncbi:MAG: hypothetical protein WCR19_02445 [Acholeplasmataceae bacterium]
MHKIKELIISDKYKVITNEHTLENTFNVVYCCDLLSAVIKHGSKNPILITQINSITTIGVATMLDLPAVILTEGKIFGMEMIEKANVEGLAIIYTELTSAETILDLKARGIL